LLDPYYADQHRYHFHKLIKEYLTDVESHKPGSYWNIQELLLDSTQVSLHTTLKYSVVLSADIVRYSTLLVWWLDYGVWSWIYLPVPHIYIIRTSRRTNIGFMYCVCRTV